MKYLFKLIVKFFIVIWQLLCALWFVIMWLLALCILLLPTIYAIISETIRDRKIEKQNKQLTNNIKSSDNYKILSDKEISEYNQRTQNKQDE